MNDDPIVAEIRAVREAHAARFNYDLRAIAADLRDQEAKSGLVYVSLPPKRLAPAAATTRPGESTEEKRS